MIRTTYILLTFILAAFNSFAQIGGYPLDYESNVSSLKKSRHYNDFLLTLIDSINHEIISYSCPDTIKTDSCKFSRLIRFGTNGKVILDSNITRYGNHTFLSMKEYSYGNGYITIRKTKLTDVITDSLVFNDVGDIIELYVNNEIDKRWYYGHKDRLVEIQKDLTKKHNKSKENFTYYADSIIVTDSSSYLNNEESLRKTFIYDQSQRLIEEWVQSKKLKHKRQKGEYFKDSVIWSRVDTIPQKTFYKYFGEDSIQITFNTKNSKQVFTLQNGEISKFISYTTISDPQVIKTHYSSTEKNKTIKTYYDDKHISTRIKDFDSIGNTVGIKDLMFEGAIIVNEEYESYNQFGFPIKSYKINKDKIIRSDIAIEEK